MAGSTVGTFYSSTGSIRSNESHRLWHFSRYLGHDTCYPQSATTLTGDQAQGVELGHWPDTNSGCDSPGEGKWSKAFPTYYSISKCNDSEVRVSLGIKVGGARLTLNRLFIICFFQRMVGVLAGQVISTIGKGYI